MTQPRWAGASKRAPILPERHPDWTAPRLLRKAEPTERQTVPAPHAKPVPAPRTESVPEPPRNPVLVAGDSSGREPERRHAIVPPLAYPGAPRLASPSPARPSPMRAAARTRFGPLLSLLIICVLGAATGLGTACLIDWMSPSAAERMTASIDTVVSALGRIGSAKLAGQPQGHGSAAIVSIPALTANSGDSGLEPLLQRARGELAAHKLEQPPGDNALDSYRQLRATWPDEKRVAQLGGAIGLAFWSLGNAAQSAGDWNKALHDFEIVNSLPPLPLGSSPSPAASSVAQ
jgi:hypothetical protein